MGMINYLSILASIPIIFWHGLDSENAEKLFPLMKESGASVYLCSQPDLATSLRVMDAAYDSGIGIYINYPDLIKNPESEASKVNTHPAFVGYYIKDEPEVWDILSLKETVERFHATDNDHPYYINLYPNWAWDENKYAERIELFANEVNVPFYSFDQYPVTQADDGSIIIRPTWYRNLEEFSDMAKRHNKPFWAFGLTWSHHLGAPSPPAFYPVPTIGQLRLQVFSDLLYGAQAIQYFTFRGLYDPDTLEKNEVFDIVKEVNEEVEKYSPVFWGCTIEGTWQTGESIPPYTDRLENGTIPELHSLSMSGTGAVVSLVRNGRHRYIAIQNRDCNKSAHMDISYKRRKVSEDILPGDIRIFKLK